MKKIIVPALLSATLLTTGCATHNISQPTAALAGSVEAPLKADVAVGEKINGEAKVNILFGLFTLGGSSKFADGVTYGAGAAPALGLPDPVSSAKSAAAYDAVSKSGADLIVAPRYVVDVNDYVVFKEVSVQVSGYKGTVKSIR